MEGIGTTSENEATASQSPYYNSMLQVKRLLKQLKIPFFAVTMKALAVAFSNLECLSFTESSGPLNEGWSTAA